MKKRELKFFAILAVAIAILCLFGLFYFSHLEQLKQKAIGTELTYVSIAGIELIEIIDAEEITAINFVNCPDSDKGCYRISIKDGPMWHVYYDPMSFEHVATEQLFVT